MPEDYHIESGRRTCCVCGRKFEPAEEYLSGLVEVQEDEEHPHGLARMDYCPDHWPPDRTDWLAFWRTRVPVPEEPARKRFVIDEGRMLDVFFRLDHTEDAVKLDLRYVIGLILIRKRRLKLTGTRRRGGKRLMLVRKSRSKDIFELEDRRLSDDAVVAVSHEIGSLLDLAETDDLEETRDES